MVFPFISVKLSSSSKVTCTSPIYIISASNGKTLDLAPFQTCGVATKPAAILNRKYASWCFLSGHIGYNENNCALSFYGDLQPNFIGIFPQAMMNLNNLVWEVDPLGDGLNKIISPSNKGYALGISGKGGLTLGVFDSTNLRQKWIIIPNTN